MLTSIIKGLAYRTHVSPNKSVEGLQGLALNFVRYQSQFAPDNVTPVTFVHVVQQCSILVKKWGADEGIDDNKQEPNMNSIVMKMYLYLLDGFILPGKRGNSLSTIIQDESFQKLRLIQKLLIQTLDNICLNTIECLEDLADFEYLWGATLRDPGKDKPLFGPDGISTYNNQSGDGDDVGKSVKGDYQCPKCLKEFNFSSSQTGAASFANHVRACKHEEQQGTKKRKSRESSVTSESIRQIAKELAWVFSRISNPNGERKQRIINAAACVDLVTASLMAPIISASATKRRRFERGVIDPRRSEEDESAAALSTILTGQSSIKSDAEYSRQLREKSKKSLLQGTSDLLSSVTNETTPTQNKDILAGAQNVASCMIPWLITENQSNKKSSPASQLLAVMSSHKLRQRNLHKLKEIYHNSKSDKMKETFSNTSLEDISNDQKALKMAWFIANLQRMAFIDSVDEFFYLSSTERKYLAPFAASPTPTTVDQTQSSDSFSVRAITYRVPEPQPMRCALQISRVKNEPLTQGELNDVNEWATALLCIVSESSSIKPSHWLMNYLEPPPAVGGFVGQMIAGSWRAKILPVLRYFIRIVAHDCQLSLHECTISDAGKYSVQQGDTTPGAVLMMYYLSLETIIRSSPMQYTMVHDAQRFHSSLFSLCYFCLRKAKQPDGRCFLLEDIGTCPIEFYKLVELFIQVLKPADSTSVMENRSLNLPAYLIRVLRQLQTMLLGMIWMSDDLEVKVELTFLGMISKLRENPVVWNQTFPTSSNENLMQGNSKEESLVRYMLGNLIHVVNQRVTTLCQLLGVSSVHTTSEKTMDLFKKVLHDRTDIFFDRHPDQLMLCSLYATLCAQRKKYAPKVGFQKVADAYMLMNRDILGSEIPYTILHRVKNCSDNARWFGDILLLYNKVFVPAVQSFWRSFKDEVRREAQFNDEASRDSDDAMENVDDEVDDDNVDDGSDESNESLKDPSSISGDNQASPPAIGAGFDNPLMQGDEGMSKDKDGTDDDGGGKVPAKPNGGDGKSGFSLPDQSDSSSASTSGEEEVDDEKASNLAESEVNTSLDDDDDKAQADIVSTGADDPTERTDKSNDKPVATNKELDQEEVDSTKEEEEVMHV